MHTVSKPRYLIVHNPAKLPGMIYGRDLEEWRVSRLMANGRYMTIDCARTETEAKALYVELFK